MDFTITPEQEGDDADEIARIVATDLCNLAHIDFHDREMVRCAIRARLSDANSIALSQVASACRDSIPQGQLRGR